ncbi:efflux RND transporter periplasmic adaptor subunit [Pseudothauera hydrothermalis]|uniref:efflux RND transporter periplasmic adaptor subunit n=1 Tax=Pseudothauera hydrothermalis TaxID=2184083 RepID=UPI000E0901BC|nr:efflux RND transporter periplasmic adaptor subunit [Pseudothauera hydrothermalis]
MRSSALSTPRARRIRIFAAVILSALAAGSGYLVWQHWRGGVPPAETYQLVAVQRADVEDLVSATGTLQPRDYVDVGAQVSGQLKRFHVEVGSEVQAGDLLAEIDATVLQSKVDATRAQLRNLRAQLTERESSLTLAEIQFRRQQNLMAEEATTTESLQQAEASLRSVRAQIEALKAQIDQVESNLRADEANLQYTRIVAPIAGTVVSISARQGQALNATQQAPVILRVADLSTMTVQTQVSEADVGRLRLGMDAYFTTLGNPGQRWSGRLRKIEPTPTVTNNVVLYNALFDVPNPDRRLMTQMTAQVFFVVARATDVLSVPMGALSNLGAGAGRPPNGAAAAERPRRQSAEAGARAARPPEAQRPRSATVRVVTNDGRIEERQVKVGVTSRVTAQILEGLQEGEQVVAGLRMAPAESRPAAPMPRLPR